MTTRAATEDSTRFDVRGPSILSSSVNYWHNNNYSSL